MATHICFGTITNTNDLPAVIGDSVHGGEAMTESGVSTLSAAAALTLPKYSNGRLVCRVKAGVGGSAIYAAVGPNPVASAATGIRLDPGDVEYIKCTVGDKVAIITV